LVETNGGKVEFDEPEYKKRRNQPPGAGVGRTSKELMDELYDDDAGLPKWVGMPRTIIEPENSSCTPSSLACIQVWSLGNSLLCNQGPTSVGPQSAERKAGLYRLRKNSIRREMGVLTPM
jgi:hypothetical protein